MIEVTIIFASLIIAPLCVSFPFYLYQRRLDKKELEADLIIERLKGINRNIGDWPGPG